MDRNYKQVGDFHILFNYPNKYELYEKIFEENMNLALSRYKFIKEEIDELQDAFLTNNKIEMIDAVCDAMYFTYGTFHVFGLVFDENRVNKVYNTGEIKINDIEELNIVNENTLEIINNNNMSANEKLMNIQSNLYKILSLCYYISNLINISHILLELCFDEVHESNLTKLCKTQDEANETILWYLQNKKNIYPNPMYRINNGYYIVYNADDNKILKSINFKLPNIQNVLKYN